MQILEFQVLTHVTSIETYRVQAESEEEGEKLIREGSAKPTGESELIERSVEKIINVYEITM